MTAGRQRGFQEQGWVGGPTAAEPQRFTAKPRVDWHLSFNSGSCSNNIGRLAGCHAPRLHPLPPFPLPPSRWVPCNYVALTCPCLLHFGCSSSSTGHQRLAASGTRPRSRSPHSQLNSPKVFVEMPLRPPKRHSAAVSGASLPPSPFPFAASSHHALLWLQAIGVWGHGEELNPQTPIASKITHVEHDLDAQNI